MTYFNKLFKQICLQENFNPIYDQQSEDILMFMLIGEGQKYIPIIKQAFNNTLNEFKQKFPNQFDNIQLKFQCEKYYENDQYCFAHLDAFKSNIIDINLFTILKEIKYNNKNIDDLLDYFEFDEPLIAHQLAHIATEKYEKITPQNSHGVNFQKELKRLIS